MLLPCSMCPHLLLISDGTALATARCQGGVHTAAYWGVVTRYTECRLAPESTVTDPLRTISEVYFCLL